ncbi:tetratricopeptide repeat protein [Aureibaculum sp. 2210JD6-5]|uniref:tetratricopeptide repeat protein n=1 Tax=Aureibaculum sp. 2210JD6-5 TaxID=3103957 RepID=UPI002AAE392D|nr:tetratricopeptide repeat protein [Aureibaculum sp. 2210JD6-5]MDY7395953.1 tetratricopeptide repeat protein [Aureibaculum sp. 2210JD6-5]
MKNNILAILLFVSIGAYANQADSLFVKANKLYQNEKYSEALELYKEIEKHNINSDDLLYNIANTYYKMNKVAPAIYYYEKVLQQSPNHTDAEFNLAFAKRMAIDNIEPLPKTLFQKINQGFIMKLAYNTWAWLGVGLSFLFAVLFLLYHFSYSSGSKRLYFITSFVSAALALATIAIAYRNYQFTKSNKEAIVFAQQTEVKTAPTVSSEVSFELHEGTKVKVLESLDNWKKIKIADGKIGWIVADDIKEL